MAFGDSRTLSVVLCGDQRLTELLRRDDLLPLGSRIRLRLTLEHATRDDLLACLAHLHKAAGNPTLLNPELDEKLFFDVFNPERTAPARRTRVRSA